MNDDRLAPGPEPTSTQRALMALRKLRSKLDALEQARREPIAIVSTACRFPGGGHDPDAFFRALEAGTDGVRRIPDDRWPSGAIAGDPPSTRWAALLDAVDGFDAEFFGISPREAQSLDPQQRLLLEVSWEALEAAGAGGGRLGSRSGVFVAMCGSDYKLLVSEAATRFDAYAGTGNALSTAAGRIAYSFGLEGPCVSVDTACSSSLVAVHLACQSLRDGECDLALVAGVNLLLAPEPMEILAQTQALSPDGRCRTFDARANGYVRGEGCGAVVLRRRSDAVREGDPTLALILGSAVNQDGRSTGLTTPNVRSQQVMLREALRRAGVAPADLGYVETHGTGTSLGDPIEIEALREVIGTPRPDGRTCVLGAVKTNIGHLEAAAGMASLIKAVECLRRAAIPKNLHFDALNPRISLDETCFSIPTETTPWPAGPGPRRAGVSAFGISGTNAHVILEEAPTATTDAEASGPWVVPLSAKHPDALLAAAAATAAAIAVPEGPSMADIAYTAACRRAHHEHRLAVVAGSREALASALSTFARREGSDALVAGVAPAASPRCVLVFSGQGSQWAGMASALLHREPVFRGSFDEIDTLVAEHAGFSLRDVLADADRLEDTEVAQPALFAIEVALAVLLRSWGVEPDAVIGHSVGEIAAAHVAGALPLADAVRLVCVRGRVMQAHKDRGTMIAVQASRAVVEHAIDGLAGVTIAAVNSPGSIVLAGEPGPLDAARTRLVSRGVDVRPLRVRYAFHGEPMASCGRDLVQALGPSLVPAATDVPMWSTVTGAEVAGTELDAAYWSRNVAEPVRFADAIAGAAAAGHTLFVEVGPHPVLTPAIEQTLDGAGHAVPTLRRDADDTRCLARALATLHVHGGPVAWDRVITAGRVVPLPAYPWQRRRYWIPRSGGPRGAARSDHPLLGAAMAIAGTGAVFERVLSIDMPELAQHRVFGRVVVPGAAVLELVRAAAAKHLGDAHCRVVGLTLEAPLVVPDAGARVQVVLSGLEATSAAVAVHARDAHAPGDAPFMRHASARIERAPEAEPPAADLADARARCREPVTRADLYTRFAAAGFDFGPLYQGVRDLFRGNGEAVARAELSEAASEVGYGIHPALLDAALQTLAATVERPGTTYLPFAFGELRVRHAGARVGWVHARAHGAADADVVAGDVWLVDDDGVRVAELRDVRFRVTDPTALGVASHTLWVPGWHPAPLAEGGAAPQDGVVVVSDGSALAEATVVSLGDAAIPGAALDDEPHTRDVIWFATPDPSDADAPDAAAERMLIAGLTLIQRLIERGGPRRLWCVTAGAQAVRPGDRVAPSAAAVWGLVRCVAHEHPDLTCTLVDVEPGSDDAPEWLSRELGARTDDREVAWRDGQRYVVDPTAAAVEPTAAAVEPTTAAVETTAAAVEPDEGASAPWAGTTMITGGLGALGLHVARWLWEQHRVEHLVLLGRRPPDAEALATIEALREQGATITVASADVSDPSAIASVLEALPGDAPLRGLIHAAGVLDDRTLARQDAASLHAALVPKAYGAWTLHRATHHLALDRFILFSSAASLLGSPGQANYAAANAFLDGLAHHRRALGLPAQSLAWGAWEGAGMVDRLDTAQRARLAREGVHRLPVAEGLRLLEQALARPDPVLAVLPADAPRRLRSVEPVASLVAPTTAREIEVLVRAAIARELALPSADDVPDERPLRELGLDSLMAVRLRNTLSASLGRSLSATLAFDYPTVRALVGHLTPAPAAVPTRRRPLAPTREPIAIIGMSCRYPGGVRSPEDFWHLLEGGVDAIAPIPRERWDADALYDPDPDRPGTVNTREGGFLDGVDRFDPAFFGISPREAAKMDPQHRLLLETTWEALERAGVIPAQLFDSATGVFVGLMYHEYWTLTDGIHALDGYLSTGGAGSVASGRISYLLGLKGPSLTIDTACSSSLVTTHLACQSLRAGESDLALAGGVALMLTPITHLEFARMRGLAPDGRCKTFDASADGVGWSEGCGMLVLKRLRDAERDGDPVLAVIRGTAVNQDGRSNGLTAPNGPSQEAVIRSALDDAGLAPADVDYVETHGTGTLLGDPIEVQAAGAVLSEDRAPGRPVWIGSVKSNLGHTQAAAGAASLIKTVLAIEHGRIPRTLHVTEPNPKIPWDELPLTIARETTPWSPGERPRVAGVSSFGVSGTNAHVVVTEPPPPRGPAAAPRDTYVLPLSAASGEALRARARDVARALDDEDARPPLPDLCYTASLRSTHHAHRVAVLGRSEAELARALEAFARGEPGAAVGVATSGPAPVTFVFSGQGSQWTGMERGLLGEPAFREALEACEAAVQRESGFSVLDQLAQSGNQPHFGEPETIHRLQPVLFAMHVALAAQWRAWGVEPDAIVGHSLGEAAAACVAGALTIDEAAKVVCCRSRLLRTMVGRGAMALVELREEEARSALRSHEDRLWISVSNGPRSTVLAGDPDALEEVVSWLEGQQVFCRRLPFGVASHCPMMSAVADELADALASLSPQRARIPIRSTVTGAVLTGEELGAAYWVDNLCKTVRFGEATRGLIADGHRIFLEVSPHPILATAVEDNLRELRATGTVIPSLRRDEGEPRVLLGSLAVLHAHGCAVDFGKHYPDGGRVVALPAYPWQRERFWIDDGDTSGGLGPLASAGNGALLRASFTTSTQPAAHFWPIDLSVAAASFADHQVRGAVVLPGAATVDLALQAAREVAGGRACAIEQMSFTRAIRLDDARPAAAELAVTRDGDDQWSFRISTRDDDSGSEWEPAATGTLRVAEAAAPPPAAIGPEDALPPGDELTAEQVVDEALARGIELGPAFQRLERVRRAPAAGEAIGWLRATPAAGHEIHPALLDAALQVVGAALPAPERDDPALRILAGIRRLCIFAAPPGDRVLWSHARVHDGEGVVTVLDQAGHTLLSIEGIDLRRVERLPWERDDAPAGPFLVERWQRADALPEPDARAPRARWLIVGPAPEGLATLLEARRQEVVPLAAGVDPGVIDEVLGGEGPPWRAVVIASALDDTEPSEGAVGDGLHMVQALARAGWRSPPRMFLLTRGTQAVGDELVEAPAGATVWGLGRTIALEHPELRCTRVDLDPAPSAGDGEAHALLRELHAEPGEDEVALRDGRRHVARLHRAGGDDVRGRDGATLRPDATYLVVGGLGGLGLHLCRWLADGGARHLVVMGRRGVTTDTQATALAALGERGLDVVVAAADATDPDALAGVLRDVDARMPPLRGVFHAAGVLADGLLVNQDLAGFAEVLRPKVRGAWNLHLATLDRALDHFVLYSSAAALFGTPGLGNYVAANAFLDALARHRRRLGLPALSIGWGAFAGVGMDTQVERRTSGGVRDFTPEEGAALFERILGVAAPHLGVIDLDARQWLEANPVAARAARFSTLHDGRAVDRSARADLLDALAEPGADRLALLTDFVAAETAAVLRMKPERLPHDAPLKSLGLDSVMGLEVRNRLEAGLGISLPATLVFTYPTVVALAEHLDRELDPTPPAPSAAPPEPDTPSPEPTEPTAPSPDLTDDELLSAFDASLDRIDKRHR